jgi:hypothetical protein
MKTQIKAKKTKNTFIDQNPVEAFKSIGGSVRQSVTEDLLVGGIRDAWDEILGVGEKSNSGDLEEGREIDLSKKKKEQPKERADAAPAIDYHREIIEFEVSANKEDQQIIQSQVKEILVELKKIEKQSEAVQVELKEISIEQRIEKPGKYHVSFFGWLVIEMRKISQKFVDNSNTWLNVMKNKKGQKNYWNMFKKHGTTFGLSNERVVATQTG